MKAQRAAVVGAGNMGKAIAWALESLGYDLIILDQSEKAVLESQKLLDISRHKFVKGTSYEMLRDCPVVVSSLPYHQNIKLATFCIDNGNEGGPHRFANPWRSWIFFPNTCREIF